MKIEVIGVFILVILGVAISVNLIETIPIWALGVFAVAVIVAIRAVLKNLR